jgi:phosphatidylglycerophosphate synthase
MPRPGSDRDEVEPRVWGLTARERLRRILLRTNVSGIRSISPDEDAPRADGRCVVLRDDLFYDERLLADLVASRSVVVHHSLDLADPPPAGAPPVGEPVAASCDGSQLPEVVERLRGMRSAGPGGLADVGVLDVTAAYNRRLRKVDAPFVFPARGPTLELREVENRLFAASYKGITDLVTKWVFPRPARAAVRVLAARGVHPNTVTAASWVLAALVAWLFAEGWFASGLLLAWLMTFLDTVDGKLARCTLTSSKFGNVFDHGLDLVHPPVWWAAWAMGLPGGIAGNELTFWIVVGGYLLGRALEGTFTLSFGIPFFVWRPFDAFFRTIIARRNPNLILLTAGVGVGQPLLGYQAVAFWTAACVVVAAARNVQGHLEARRGVEIHSWLDDLEADEAPDVATSATA